MHRLLQEWWHNHRSVRKGITTLELAPGEFLRTMLDHLDRDHDGTLSIDELERSIRRPPATFTAIEIQFLELLEKYFRVISELSNDQKGRDRGISGKDLLLLQSLLEDVVSRQV